MEQTIVVEWPQFVGPHAGWWQLHGWFCVNDDDDDDEQADFRTFFASLAHVRLT